MKQRLFHLMLTALIAAAFVLAFGAAIVNIASATPDNPPAHTIQSYARYTLLTSNGITQTANGTGVRIAGYDFADCFEVVDATLVQTATVALQASADGTNYVTVLSYSSATTDTATFTRTAIYGEYFRAAVTSLGNTNPVTVSVRCVMKN